MPFSYVCVKSVSRHAYRTVTNRAEIRPKYSYNRLHIFLSIFRPTLVESCIPMANESGQLEILGHVLQGIPSFGFEYHSWI